MPLTVRLLSHSSGPDVDRNVKQTRGNDTNCWNNMATRQQPLLQRDQQSKENIRKLFETKKNFETTRKTVTPGTTKTCPRSISYTNLENATNSNNLAATTYQTYQQKGLPAFSQINGQIANQQLQVEENVLQHLHQQQYEDHDDVDYAFDYVRRNSSATSSSKIKRWHVVGHKGNDVTKDMKLAKSLLGPNQLPTRTMAKEIPISLEHVTDITTNSTATAFPLAKSTSTNSLSRQHNQLVITGSMGFLNTSSQHDDFHQKELKPTNRIYYKQDKDGVDYYDGYDVPYNNSTRLNNNYTDSCPTATTITTPKARRPSKHWYKRKNWYSQDDADDFDAQGYDGVNDARQTFHNKQLQLQEYSQPIYNASDYRTTNNNVINYNDSNETENCIKYKNNNDSNYYGTSNIQQNVTNAFSYLNQEDNTEDYIDNNDDDYDHYNRTDINLSPANWQHAIQQTNDKDKYFYRNSKDLRIPGNNNSYTNETDYEHHDDNNNVAVTENLFKTKMPVGHAAVCQNENKKSHNSKNQQPQFTTNEQQSTQTAMTTKTSYSTPPSPTLKQLMKIKLKTKSQEIVAATSISNDTNATEANSNKQFSKLYSNYKKNWDQEILPTSTTTTLKATDKNTLKITTTQASLIESDFPNVVNSLNVIQDSNNAGCIQKVQVQHDYKLNQHHKELNPQHQQYLPTSSSVAVTDVNEYKNSYSNVFKDENTLLNDR